MAAREAEEDQGIDEEADVPSEEETKGKGRGKGKVNVKQDMPKEPAAPPKLKPKPRKKAKPSIPQPAPAPAPSPPEIEDSSPPVELGKRKWVESSEDVISVTSDFTTALSEPTSIPSSLATDVSVNLLCSSMMGKVIGVFILFCFSVCGEHFARSDFSWISHAHGRGRGGK